MKIGEWLFLIFIIGLVIAPLVLIARMPESKCVQYGKIKKMEMVTERQNVYIITGAPIEWLYIMENGEKLRFMQRYYPGEEVCIEYK